MPRSGEARLGFGWFGFGLGVCEMVGSGRLRSCEVVLGRAVSGMVRAERPVR